MPKAIRRKRFSAVVSLIAAVFAFPWACILAAVAVGAILGFVDDSVGAISAAARRTLDEMMVGTAIGLPLLLAYLVSRGIYSLMHWQTVHDRDGRYCLQCEYDLTGNVSGRCPECGQAVPWKNA